MMTISVSGSAMEQASLTEMINIYIFVVFYFVRYCSLKPSSTEPSSLTSSEVSMFPIPPMRYSPDEVAQDT